MKAIILAGGKGSRLYPLTTTNSKQLLPVYDKPMIYYPLSIGMMGGIREVLIISTPEHLNFYKNLLSDGKQLGIQISYIVQIKPEGLAQALILGEEFIKDDSCILILGDNILYGHGLQKLLNQAISQCEKTNSAVVLGYPVKNPTEYGVAEIKDDEVISIEEKPKQPKSNNAVIGLYFYPNDAVKKAKEITKSERGELEITSLNNLYIKEKRLRIELLGRGYAWFDSGTHTSLLEAANFIKTIQDRQGLYIGCIEEVALKQNFISTHDLKQYLANNSGSSDYNIYLKNLGL